MKNEKADTSSKKQSTKKISKVSDVISYNGSDTAKMRRYGTSATVSVSEVTDKGAQINVNAYDGNDLKPDVLIRDSLKKLKKQGVTGEIEFKIKAKYGEDSIKAYDPEDEDSNFEDGGKYNIEVGHNGLSAYAKID